MEWPCFYWDYLVVQLGLWQDICSSQNIKQISNNATFSMFSHGVIHIPLCGIFFFQSDICYDDRQNSPFFIIIKNFLEIKQSELRRDTLGTQCEILEHNIWNLFQLKIVFYWYLFYIKGCQCSFKANWQIITISYFIRNYHHHSSYPLKTTKMIRSTWRLKSLSMS